MHFHLPLSLPFGFRDTVFETRISPLTLHVLQLNIRIYQHSRQYSVDGTMTGELEKRIIVLWTGETQYDDNETPERAEVDPSEFGLEHVFCKTGKTLIAIAIN